MVEFTIKIDPKEWTATYTNPNFWFDNDMEIKNFFEWLASVFSEIVVNMNLSIARVDHPWDYIQGKRKVEQLNLQCMEYIENNMSRDTVEYFNGYYRK